MPQKLSLRINATCVTTNKNTNYNSNPSNQRWPTRPITITEDSTTAIEELKTKLCSQPILQFPDFNRPFILETDASIKRITVILMQLCDRKKVIIAAVSRTSYWEKLQYCGKRGKSSGLGNDTFPSVFIWYNFHSNHRSPMLEVLGKFQ